MEPLNEAVDHYKEQEKAKEKPPEINVGFLKRVIDSVSDDSDIRVCIDPLDEKRRWIHDCTTLSVHDVKMDDQGRLVLYVHNDNQSITSGKLYEKIAHMGKDLKDNAEIIFYRHDQLHKIDDIYSHTIVRNFFAGLPFDVALIAYTGKDPEVLLSEQPPTETV